MNQLTLFDVTKQLPQRGDVLLTTEGKNRVIGSKITWGGQELILYADPDHILKAKSPSEFQKCLKKGEFVRK